MVRPPTASFLPDWLNPDVFLRDPALGPWIILLICGIVFAETGLLVGFFLPGDSMLFTAGLLIATGALDVNLPLFAALIFVSAFVGDQTGYLIGRKAGPAIFKRPDSHFFRQEYVDHFTHGGCAFDPAASTLFAPAGAGAVT